jgi:hypothetical protein
MSMDVDTSLYIGVCLSQNEVAELFGVESDLFELYRNEGIRATGLDIEIIDDELTPQPSVVLGRQVGTVSIKDNNQVVPLEKSIPEAYQEVCRKMPQLGVEQEVKPYLIMTSSF